MRDYRFGERVSFKILEMHAEGVITFAEKPGKGPVYYHVRDEHGKYWHRTGAELKTLPNG